MSFSPGDMVRVPHEFFTRYVRSYLGLRPSPDSPVHDETSPGLVGRDDIMIVLSTTEVPPHRWETILGTTDVRVVTSTGTTGWIFDYNLEVVK